MLKNSLYILAAVLLLCGCGEGRGRSRSDTHFTIATLKGPSSMGMIKMIDSLSNMEGSNVQVKILNEPLQVRKMMIDGTADFAILPTTMAAIVYNKGLEFRLLGIPVWGTLYLFGSDSTVTCWSDLKGKRVYVMARGMTPDVLFRHLLRKNGLDPESDIKLDYSFPTHIDLANAVAAGQADLGVISEPLASMVMQRNKSVKLIFDLVKEWKLCEGTPVAETAFMGRERTIQNDRETVERVVSGYKASVNWVNMYPDSAAQLIVKYGILPDKDVAMNAIPRSNLKFVRADEAENQIMEYLDIFFQMNPDIVGGKMPDENFIYR